MSREKQSGILVALIAVLVGFSITSIPADSNRDPLTWRQNRHADFSPFQPSGQLAVPSLVQTKDLLVAGSETEDLLISESVGPANFIQDDAALVGLRGGRMVSTWEDDRFGPVSVVLQLLDNSGVPIGANTGLIIGEDFDLQDPVNCADTSGYFYVVWRESSNGHLQAARFDSLGAPTTTIFFVSDTTISGYAGEFAAACTPDGKLVVAWEQYTIGNTIEFRVFGTDGLPLTGAVTANSDGLAVKHWSPTVVIGINNDIAIAWEDYRNTKADIYLRRFNSSGTPYAVEFQLSDADARFANRYMPDLAYSSTDGYVAGWTDLREGVNIYLQRLNSSGVLQGSNILLSGGYSQDDNWEIDLGVGSTGRLLAVWTLYNDQNAILLQKFLTNLQMQGAPQIVSGATESQRYGPAVAEAGSGNIGIIWTNLILGSKDIRASVLNANGSTVRPVFTVNDDLTGSPSFDPDVAGFSRYEWSVVFTDQRRDAGDIMIQQIYVIGGLIGTNRRINSDGPGGIQTEPAIAAGQDVLCISWTDNRGSSLNHNLMCRFARPHMDLTEEIVVNDDGGTTPKYNSDLIITDDTLTLVVWTDLRTGVPKIYGQLFDAGYQKTGDNFLIGPSGSGEAGEMAVVMIQDEFSFLVAYLNQTNNTIAIKRVSTSGSVTDAFTFASNRPGYAINDFDIVRTPNDELIIVWQGYDAGKTDLFLSKFDFEGLPVLATRAITDDFNANPGGPSMAANHEGYLLVSWLDQRTGANTPFRQIFDPFMNPLQGNVPVYSEAGPYMQAPVTGALFGRGLFVWADARNNGLNIYGSLVIYSPTDADDRDVVIPVDYSLSQNYPNPFNPSTTIYFSLPRMGQVRVEVINLLGQIVLTLTDDVYPAGNHSLVWDGTDHRGETVASGIYFYRMQSEGYLQTRKMVFMK